MILHICTSTGNLMESDAIVLSEENRSFISILLFIFSVSRVRSLFIFKFSLHYIILSHTLQNKRNSALTKLNTIGENFRFHRSLI